MQPVAIRAVAVFLTLVAFPLGAAAGKPLHHDLDLTLDPAAGSLQAEDRIDIAGHQRLVLKLAPGFELAEVTIDGEPVEPMRAAGLVRIELPDRGTHRVGLRYGGVLGGGSGGDLSPLLAAEGGFLRYGIGWLADAGALDDRVTYELAITTPAPYKAIATGALAAESEEGGRYRATFKATRPSEPPSVFAGDYAIDERDHGGVRLRTYFPGDQASLAATYLDQAGRYLDRFQERIGDYPYDGFSMIAAPLPVGMGFPGLTYVAAQILAMPFMQTRSLAHEILHNWWANGVAVDYAEGNWAEGLTTYMADYALAEAEGPASAEEMRLGWLRDYAALPETRDRPLAAFRGKGHDADQVVGYNKAAMVFHMLRQEIGAAAFDAGLRAFWSKNRFETAGWSDLRASFETASGRKLGGFFAPWLSETGAPALALDAAEVEESGSGFALALRLASDRPGYDLLVPVQIETDAGIETRTVRLQAGAAEVTFDLDRKPRSVGIDQRHDVFRRLAEGEAPPILRDVTLDPDVLTVLVTDGEAGADEVGRQLAERTLDTGVRLAALDDAAVERAPLMLIGLAADVAPALGALGIDAVPQPLQGRGTARSWIAGRKDAPPVLVVEAADSAALASLVRPLPHYGRSSFLVFEGRKVVEEGVWPTGDNALIRRFD